MKNISLVIIYTTLLILGTLAIKHEKSGPITRGSLTIEQVMGVYQDTTGLIIQTEVAKTDSSYPIFKEDSKRLAICATFNSGFQQIIINTDKWVLSTDEERVYILFHEIGHCDFGWDHSEDPLNVMYFELGPEQVEHFSNNFKEQVKQFTGGK